MLMNSFCRTLLLKKNKTNLSTLLSRVISSESLTTLSINTYIYCLSKILEILRSAPNINTLNIKLSSINILQTTYRLISMYGLRETNAFQSVAKQNKIQHLTFTCNTEIPLILFVGLCSQLQHLTTNADIWNCRCLLEFLLPMIISNTDRLKSLHIENATDSDSQTVKKFIESHKHLRIDSSIEKQWINKSNSERYTIFLLFY